MKITFISDTHTKHSQCRLDLPGGDLIIHCGDFMSTGYSWKEAEDFLVWYNELDQYDHKILIAGNHDRLFENHMEDIPSIMNEYQNITYLFDQLVEINGLKIWGSPWQPEFFNWAFNLPRYGDELAEKWSLIPDDCDILITHGPPFGHLDISGYGNKNVGCELLRHRVDTIKPLIHCFGHIHSNAGFKFDGNTNYFNASILDERYNYQHKPLTIDLNVKTKRFSFV